MSITVPAARVIQGELSLYTTSLKVRDIMKDGFYSIDRLDPEAQQAGYQRVLQTSRAKRLADYIIRGQDTKDAFLPTSVFLATENNIAFNEEDHTITFDVNDIGSFSVVDGQHRLEGLRLAAQKDSRVLDFQIPVNIAYNLPFWHQMCHFLIVNTTQKSVDKGIEQQIISRLTKSIDVEDIPNLPKWIQTIIDKGDTEKALRLVEYLNEEEGSPWQGKVRIANQQRTPRMTINQASFVTTINANVMTASHPLRAIGNTEKEQKIFLNYWRAIANLLEPDDESETVLYKYVGITVFSIFSIPFFHKLNSAGDYRVETMESHLTGCFDNIEAEYEGAGTPEWWLSGTGQAGGLNSAAARKVAVAMSKALNSFDVSKEIQL